MNIILKLYIKYKIAVLTARLRDEAIDLIRTGHLNFTDDEYYTRINNELMHYQQLLNNS